VSPSSEATLNTLSHPSVTLPHSHTLPFTPLPTSLISPSLLFQPDTLRSFSHSCYTTDGHHDASLSVLASHLHPRCPPPLSSSLLLSHAGDLPPSTKYQSEHSRAFGPRDDDHALLKTLKAKADKTRAKDEEDERERTTRDRTYKTVASESFSAQHSVWGSDEKRSPFLVKPSVLTTPAAVLSLRLRK
jgi:hypothetical protein